MAKSHKRTFAREGGTARIRGHISSAIPQREGATHAKGWQPASSIVKNDRIVTRSVTFSDFAALVADPGNTPPHVDNLVAAGYTVGLAYLVLNLFALGARR